MHRADDRAPAAHHHGVDARDGAGPRPPCGVRVARRAAAGPLLRLLRDGQGRRTRQLVYTYTHNTYISTDRAFLRRRPPILTI